MPYELNMSVDYNEITKQVTVMFRGEKVVLPGPYDRYEDGKRAGEDHCRQRGWQG